MSLIRYPLAIALAALLAGPLMEPHMQARILHLRLQSYYSVHAPSQLDKLEYLVEKYGANEAELLRTVEAKYGVPVPEVNIWQLHDPLGVSAHLIYSQAKLLFHAASESLHVHFPHVRSAVDARIAQLGSHFGIHVGEAADALSKPALLITLVGLYVVIASRVRGSWRAIALLLLLCFAALVVRPSLDDLSPAKLHGGLTELVDLATRSWSPLAIPARVAAISASFALAGLTVGRQHPSAIVLCWLLTVLAISNPHLPASPKTLDIVGQLGVANAASLSLFRHTDEHLFALHDLTFYSVLALAPSAGKNEGLSEWSSPMLALGIADRWFVLSHVEATKTDKTHVSISLPGVALPVFVGPMLLAALVLIGALLSGL